MDNEKSDCIISPITLSWLVTSTEAFLPSLQITDNYRRLEMGNNKKRYHMSFTKESAG